MCRWISLSQTLKDRRFSNAAKHVGARERVQRARVNVRACACLRLLDGSGCARSKRNKRAHALMHKRKLSFLPTLPREPALARFQAGGTACGVVICRPNQGMLLTLCGARVLLRTVATM